MALAELNAGQPLLERARDGTMIFAYLSHDTERNNASAFEEFLQHHLHAEHSF
jgi:hypothetical protein